MKNYFSKKLMILAFAFGGLFMIGNNVFATDPNDSEDPGEGGGTITCTRTWKWHQINTCWVQDRDPETDKLICRWTGLSKDKCDMP